LTCGQKPLEAAVMGISETRRDDQFCDVLTDGVRLAASEHPLGGRVEVAHPPSVVDRDDPVEGRLEDPFGSVPRGLLTCEKTLSLLLSLELLGDISVRPEPANHGAIAIANGQCPRQEPPKLPVVAAERERIFPGFACLPGTPNSLYYSVNVLRVVDLRPSPALNLVEGRARELEPSPVEPEDPPVCIRHPGELSGHTTSSRGLLRGPLDATSEPW
jgi:hypothetical protein